MNRRLLMILSIAALSALALTAVLPVLGSGPVDAPSQTWPSRTPTPSGGPQPTNPPGTEPPPEQTSVATIQPGSTPLATQQPPGAGQSTGAPAAGGANVPSVGSEGSTSTESEPQHLPSSAEVGDCGLPPIAVALGPVNVRSGPGIEFNTIDALEFQDERVIVGRAANAPWWQILLTIQQLGWVSDQAVAVKGYTGAVPVTSEDVAGSGPQWNPTPNPACTPPSQEEITISDGQLAAVLLAQTPTAEGDRPPTPAPDDGLASEDSSSPGFSLLRPDDSATGMSLIWLPIVGGFLIVAGGIALLVQRRQT